MSKVISRLHFSRKSSFSGYVRISQKALEKVQEALLLQAECKTFFSAFWLCRRALLLQKKERHCLFQRPCNVLAALMLTTGVYL